MDNKASSELYSNPIPKPQKAIPMQLYHYRFCPFCRSVRLTIKTLGLEVTEVEIDLRKGEQLTAEFMQLNPRHTVPVLIDDDLVMTESRAIMMYLADKYDKKGVIYPKDPKARAWVNERMFFDMATLSSRYVNCYVPVLRHGDPLDPAKKKLVHDALDIIDGYLTQTKYIAGQSMTIADHAFVAVISTLAAVRLHMDPYKRINWWYNRCQSVLPGYQEIVQDNLDAFVEEFVSKCPYLQPVTDGCVYE